MKHSHYLYFGNLSRLLLLLHFISFSFAYLFSSLVVNTMRAIFFNFMPSPDEPNNGKRKQTASSSSSSSSSDLLVLIHGEGLVIIANVARSYIKRFVSAAAAAACGFLNGVHGLKES
jgi:hypothetical protein